PGVTRRDGLRRIFCLLQLLPCDRRVVARQSVLQARHRTATARDWNSAGRWVSRFGCSLALSARRIGARDRGKLARSDRRGWLRRVDDVRAAHVLGRRGRHNQFEPARFCAVFVDRRSERDLDRVAVYRVDTQAARALVAARVAYWKFGCGEAKQGGYTLAALWLLPSLFNRARTGGNRAAGPGFTEMDWTDGWILWRWNVVAWGVGVLRARLADAQGEARDSGPRMVAGFKAGL